MNRILVVLISVVLAGCGSSRSVVGPVQQTAPGARLVYYLEGVADPEGKAPEQVRAAVLGHLKQELRGTGLLAEDRGQADRLVEIKITEYRMRSGFGRAVFGLFGGRDGMAAMVCISDAATAEVLGQSAVSCFNATAIGSEEDVARVEAREIAKYLLGSGQ